MIVGGSGPAAARRAGRLGDGYYPIAPTVAVLADPIALMRSAAAEVGRDPAEIEVSTMAFSLGGPDPVSRAQLDDFHQMEDLAVTRIVAPGLLDSTATSMLTSLDRLGEQLLGAC